MSSNSLPEEVSPQSTPVILVDGSGYIFRAYYAVAPLTNSGGFPTNALFGYMRMMIKLIQEYQNSPVVVIFDTAGKNFRHELYPEYKANRSECPEDLKVQMPYFRSLSKALGLPVLEKDGYEADDIIGTLSTKLSKSGAEVIIVSGDKDLMQLVDERILVVDTMKNKTADIAAVKEKFGIGPQGVADYLALVGDSSDNIPGLQGVGEKSAKVLLEHFGSIEQLIEKSNDILELKSLRGRKKIHERVLENPDTLTLSKQLAKIDCQVPLLLSKFEEGHSHDLLLEGADSRFPDGSHWSTALDRRKIDRDSFHQLIEQFEFQSLLKNFDPAEEGERHTIDTDYRTVTYGCIDEMLSALSKSSYLSLDLETTSLDPIEAEIVGIALCAHESIAWYIPVAHEEGNNVKLEDALSALKSLINERKISVIGQNLKYDLQVLAKYNVFPYHVLFDSMIAAYLINPDSRALGLNDLCLEHLNITVISYADVVKSGESFASVSIQNATDYAAEDAHMVWLLKPLLEAKLEENDLVDLFNEMELPLMRALVNIELRGLPLDHAHFQTLSDEWGAELERLRGKIFEISGREFNLNSPKQLAEVLFEELDIPTRGVKKNKTGFSTDSGVLEKLAQEYEMPRLLLLYRSLFKLKSTYVDALPKKLNEVTGRIHTRLNQTVTGTGRLSSSNPNLQNIPIAGIEGRRIRSGFIAPDGCALISADYSQIELRVLAHMSNDPGLIDAFSSGEDIHARTSRDLFGLSSVHDVTPEQRRYGKTINFGIVYGMSAFRLGKELGISNKEAQLYIDNYFKTFAGVKSYFSALEEQALSSGEVRTLFGRRRLISGLDSSGRDKGFLLRAAINAPIQGTAADLIKKAMIVLEQSKAASELGLRLLLQVHDELLFSVPDGRAEEGAALVTEYMESVFPLCVPLKVDTRFGSNWGEIH